MLIDAALPTAVVVSDLCREGLASLVEHEMIGEQKAENWLFESLEDAYDALVRQRNMK
jgi:hypothetical protein